MNLYQYIEQRLRADGTLFSHLHKALSLYEIYMKHLLLISIFNLSFVWFTEAQGTPNNVITKKDSLLLAKFWNSFKKSINQKDTATLITLFNLPFNCTPCWGYIPRPDPSPPTLYITKTMFYSRVCRLFFDLPKKNKSTEKLWNKKFVFSPANKNRNQRAGFMFSYRMISPTNEQEGMQALVYVKKIRGKYVITSLDTVP